MEKFFDFNYFKNKYCLDITSYEKTNYNHFWLIIRMFCEMESFETKNDLLFKTYSYLRDRIKYDLNEYTFIPYKDIFDEFLIELEKTQEYLSIEMTPVTKWKKLEIAISLFKFSNYIDDFYD